MKSVKFITLIISLVFLMAWSVTAHESDIGNGFFGAKQLSMLQKQLELTGEQATVVQDILVASKEAMEKIVEGHGLQREEMRKVHGELKKFREQDLEKLAVILDHEQFQALREEIFTNGPFGFMQLPEKEKLAYLQNLLGFSEEKVNQVTVILGEGKVKREKILEDLGLNPALMMTFQQDMVNCRKEMEMSLREALSEKQMKQLEGLRNQMKPRSRDLTIHSWIKVNCYGA